jgi:putative IMPACT (imprinted ancient) family translation regulator
MFTEDLIALATKAIPGGSVRAYKRAMDTIEVARGRMERAVVKVLRTSEPCLRTSKAKAQAVSTNC